MAFNFIILWVVCITSHYIIAFIRKYYQTNSKVILISLRIHKFIPILSYTRLRTYYASVNLTPYLFTAERFF